MTRLYLLLVTATLVVPSVVQAKRLEVAEVKSNSVLTDNKKGIVYSVDNMLDEQSATMWVEGEGSAGLGKYIEVKFSEEVELSKIRIWAGCFIDEEYWERHNRIKAVELKFPDFTSERIEIKDRMEPQWLELAEPKTLSKFKIYLRAVYDGNTWNDTGISQIEFFDSAGPEEDIEGMTASASSTYGDKEDGFTASNVVDGWLDTYWVEGGDTGDGEYIDIRLGGRKELKRFAIAMGFDMTDSFFQGANRAGKATLSFSDGSTQEFALADEKGLQYFDLARVDTSTVRVTFGDIRRGKTTNELYASEVRFWE